MIDLRSDTVTYPSETMRKAAANAEVGDDVFGEDPTVNKLQQKMATLLGTEKALFVPSGTMGNQIAVRVHTKRGQEVLCETDSHVLNWEGGGMAQHAQVQPRPLAGDDRGVLTADQVESNIVESGDHHSGTGLLALENTHNGKGGTAIAPGAIEEAAQTAHELDIPVHLDGARLFNAAVALDTPLDSFTEPVDSVMCCLSKGLGAPIGSILAGPTAFIESARRIRKLMGGGMRQVGIIAAPALEALEQIDRLEEDHRRATRLATGIDETTELEVRTPESNIVFVETAGPAEAFLDRCEDVGVLGVPFGKQTVRFCTHLDVNDEDIDRAIDLVGRVA